MSTLHNNNIGNVFVNGTWRYPPCPTCRKPHSPAWSCWDICNSCFERHPWGQCPTITRYQPAPMVAIPQPAATVSFRPVQPEQMPLPQMGLHQVPPDQETQHLQQLFRQFLAEESPQIFQQFLQWRQMQSAQQQPMMPAPVQQTHPAQQQSMMPLPQYQVRFHMGATVSLQSPSPQMPHQRPLPTRDGTPMISPATPTRRTSVTPRRLNRSAQSKASSRGSKKEDRSSLAPIFDPANMVSKKKKRRRRRCKKHRADRVESEAGDQSGAEEVEVKQEVKQNVKQEASSPTFAA